MSERAHLLVVDADLELRVSLSRMMEVHGFRVTSVSNARDARQAWSRAAFQLVVLDVTLPGEDGRTLARWLLDQDDVPIMFLSALDTDTDRIIGLELGAADYVSKPCNPRELLARIRAILRRKTRHPLPRSPSEQKSISFSGWTLEVSTRRLLNPDGVEVPLTGGEFELLLLLLRRPNCILARGTLEERLRKRGSTSGGRSVDVAVSRLRRRLGERGGGALIKTVHGGGYVLAGAVQHL